MNNPLTKAKRTWVIISLMIASEIIFLLPFVITRVFRPTFLSVFEISNLELGTAFSLYGIVAMVSYFAGGIIADRFSPRLLMTGSLIVTAIGGIFIGFIPSINILTYMYGFWGASTILLYWAASIKAIREYGGVDTQGGAFGLIDGGRGLIAALIATFSVLLFERLLPTDISVATHQNLSDTLGLVIWIFSGLVFMTALLVWLTIPDYPSVHHPSAYKKPSLQEVKKAFKHQSVWWQAIIVLCSYVGYKCTDGFSLYAQDTFGLDDISAAHVGTISFWCRPAAALIAGSLGDRYQISKMTLICFLIVIAGSLIISTGIISSSPLIVAFFSIGFISSGIYGLRGLYFALMAESNIPLSYTGSAIGVVSVIGYTPDIFMGPLMGYILDSNPGELGHQYLFGTLAVFSVIGLIATIMFRRVSTK